MSEKRTGVAEFDRVAAENKIKSVYNRFIKRIIDTAIAFIALVLLSWLFLIIIIIIKADSKGPAVFKQRRVGCKQNGVLVYFNIYKFRTMRCDAPVDVPTHLFVDVEKYTTRFGKFLRKTSLDELPQLLNILFGQMAVIGPRPALWNQTDLIAEREKYLANDLRPGLTGWAQINGRDMIEIPVKARLDGEYAEKLSFAFDVRCFIRTIACVLRRGDIIG